MEQDNYCTSYTVRDLGGQKRLIGDMKEAWNHLQQSPWAIDWRLEDLF